MRYEFHPDALAEYEEAARYYAGCQEGLELRFIAAVEHTVQQIPEAPERGVSWKKIFGGVLRVYFLMLCCIPSKRSTCLLLRLCTATVSPVTGIIVFPIEPNIAHPFY